MNKIRKPLLDVLHGQVPEHVPVWLMRQAGRYLPEYREIRSNSKNFLNMCLTPELATEITLQPIRRFNVDAAILFADILLVPMALGQDLEFREGEGPVLKKVTDKKSIDQLVYEEEKVLSVFETVRRVKRAIPEATTLIGFCGAPWTVACYMIDGNSKNDFSESKMWVNEQPENLSRLVEILVHASEAYLSSQIEAGAECLQIFDSWAGLLSGKQFERYVIEPTQNLISRLKTRYPDIPIIGFPRGAQNGYELYIKRSGVDAMSIDQSVNLQVARDRLQIVKPLQGNLDPDLLVQGGDSMKKKLAEIIDTFGLKHIVNLGHGVVPQTPLQNVADLVNFVHGYAV